jgi:WD40 repeat protein
MSTQLTSPMRGNTRQTRVSTVSSATTTELAPLEDVLSVEDLRRIMLLFFTRVNPPSTASKGSSREGQGTSSRRSGSLLRPDADSGSRRSVTVDEVYEALIVQGQAAVSRLNRISELREAKEVTKDTPDRRQSSAVQESDKVKRNGPVSAAPAVVQRSLDEDEFVALVTEALGIGKEKEKEKEADPSPQKAGMEDRNNKSFGQSTSWSHLPADPARELETENEREAVPSQSERISTLSLYTESDVRQWFSRVDCDGVGGVTWDDFSTYILSHGHQRRALEQRLLEYSTKATPSTCPQQQQHSNFITVMIPHPKSGRVFTASRDGSIREWSSENLKLVGEVYSGVHWVTSMCFLKGGNKLLTTAVDRSISIFDVKTAEMLRTYVGRDIDESEYGLRYALDSVETVQVGQSVPSHAAPKTVPTRSLHRMGPGRDDGSKIKTFEQFKSMLESERSKQIQRKKLDRAILSGLNDTPVCVTANHFVPGNDDVIYVGLRGGSILVYQLPSLPTSLVRLSHCWPVHSKQINQMYFVPHLQCLLTCSDDCTAALTDVKTGEVTRRLSVNGHERGVHSAAWSEEYKVIVTCGAERIVHVWKHLQDSPIYTISDHLSPMLSVAINEDDGHLLTLATDGTFKVYELKTLNCIQTFTERRLDVQSRSCDTQADYTVMTFDSERKRILAASTFPAMYSLRKRTGAFPPNYLGHTLPVIGTMYSPVFHQLLTAENDAIIVWNAKTGKCNFTFPFQSFSGLLEDCRLTSFQLDVRLKRLLTGFHQGISIVWNFTNGQPMNVIRVPEANGDVQAFASMERMGQIFFVLSIGKDLWVAKDAQQFTVTQCSRWAVPEHYGPVTSITQCSLHLVACGTMNGAVFFFHIINEGQDGRPMMLEDTDRLNQGSASIHLSPGTDAILFSPRSTANIQTLSTSLPPATFGSLGVKVETVLSLPTLGKDMLAVIHADGRVVFWDHQRRACLAILFLQTTSGSPANITFEPLPGLGGEVPHRAVHLVYNDEQGNVYLWIVSAAAVQPGSAKGNETSGSGSEGDASFSPADSTESPLLSSMRHCVQTLDAHWDWSGTMCLTNFWATDKIVTGFTIVAKDEPVGLKTTEESSPSFTRKVEHRSTLPLDALKQDPYPLIIMTGTDCSVRVFSRSGECLGWLGHKAYHVEDPKSWQNPTPLPPVEPSLNTQVSLRALNAQSRRFLKNSPVNGPEPEASPGSARLSPLKPKDALHEPWPTQAPDATQPKEGSPSRNTPGRSSLTGGTMKDETASPIPGSGPIEDHPSPPPFWKSFLQEGSYIPSSTYCPPTEAFPVRKLTSSQSARGKSAQPETQLSIDPASTSIAPTAQTNRVHLTVDVHHSRVQRAAGCGLITERQLQKLNEPEQPLDASIAYEAYRRKSSLIGLNRQASFASSTGSGALTGGGSFSRAESSQSQGGPSLMAPIRPGTSAAPGQSTGIDPLGGSAQRRRSGEGRSITGGSFMGSQPNLRRTSDARSDETHEGEGSAGIVPRAPSKKVLVSAPLALQHSQELSRQPSAMELVALVELQQVPSVTTGNRVDEYGGTSQPSQSLSDRPRKSVRYSVVSRGSSRSPDEEGTKNRKSPLSPSTEETLNQNALMENYLMQQQQKLLVAASGNDVLQRTIQSSVAASRRKSERRESQVQGGSGSSSRDSAREKERDRAFLVRPGASLKEGSNWTERVASLLPCIPTKEGRFDSIQKREFASLRGGGQSKTSIFTAFPPPDPQGAISRLRTPSGSGSPRIPSSRISVSVPHTSSSPQTARF